MVGKEIWEVIVEFFCGGDRGIRRMRIEENVFKLDVGDLFWYCFKIKLCFFSEFGSGKIIFILVVKSKYYGILD